MTQSETQRDEVVELRMTWDAQANAGYLYLTEIAPGEAVRQELVIAPGESLGMATVVLDFDRQGRLLGIEFLGKHLLPPGLDRLAPDVHEGNPPTTRLEEVVRPAGRAGLSTDDLDVVATDPDLDARPARADRLRTDTPGEGERGTW